MMPSKSCTCKRLGPATTLANLHMHETTCLAKAKRRLSQLIPAEEASGEHLFRCLPNADLSNRSEKGSAENLTLLVNQVDLCILGLHPHPPPRRVPGSTELHVLRQLVPQRVVDRARPGSAGSEFRHSDPRQPHSTLLPRLLRKRL